MRLIVFGAAGATGTLIVDQALERNHEVTAFVRTPPEPAPPGEGTQTREGLQTVRGDAHHEHAVTAAIGDHDAVLSALGGDCALGIEAILAGMQATGVRRLIAISNHGVGDSNSGFWPFLMHRMLAAKLADKERMESALRGSDVDWTSVRAPRLTNGKRTGRYRVQEHLKVGPFPSISRADLAEFMLSQLQDDAFVRKTPSIAY